MYERVRKQVLHVGVVSQGPAADANRRNVLDQAPHHSIRPDVSGHTVFQFGPTEGHLVSIVFAAYKTFRRYLHIVEGDYVAHAPGSICPQKIHEAAADAGQVGRHVEPTEVLVTLALGICAHENHPVIDVVGGAHKRLLAVHDVVVAVANGCGLQAVQVGTGPWFSEQLHPTTWPENMSGSHFRYCSSVPQTMRTGPP